jgi:hypothetical protein
MQRSGIRGFWPRAPDSDAARLHPGHGLLSLQLANLSLEALMGANFAPGSGKHQASERTRHV